jgi:uncharacterized membrane protein YkoI
MIRGQLMKPLLLTLCVVGAFAVQPVSAQDEAPETKVKLQELPPAVQEAVKAQSKGATVRGFSKEVKDGRALYEAELSVKGRTRDLTFDAQGRIVSDEQQTTLSDIPAAARAAIQKAAAGGKLTLVEKVIEGSSTSYEGHFTKAGKEGEIKVDANGKPVE